SVASGGVFSAARDPVGSLPLGSSVAHRGRGPQTHNRQPTTRASSPRRNAAQSGFEVDWLTAAASRFGQDFQQVLGCVVAEPGRGETGLCGALAELTEGAAVHQAAVAGERTVESIGRAIGLRQSKTVSELVRRG